MLKAIEPHPGNIADAALLWGAAAKVRKVWLDLEAEVKAASTVYATDALSEALDFISDAADTLSRAAASAAENAIEDAAGEEADRAYDNARDE